MTNVDAIQADKRRVRPFRKQCGRGYLFVSKTMLNVLLPGQGAQRGFELGTFFEPPPYDLSGVLSVSRLDQPSQT
ncbi:hypothetical protein [Chelativorans sp. M5D2P16]|uniref:hypothetical protein n=1 Tax=Chelativorans sp. M5D2P16 TaxID=3095678 RepID=UPI002AC9FA00|nr:hypothetical protein [Chelativorans sp. M5D2P16]MDZ5697628.1 hypothetical protein [Chelativorans sp. M5D2P16]